MFIRIFIVVSILCIGLLSESSCNGQVPVNRQAEKASKKNIRSLEKEYKKALKYHKKIQTRGGNKRSKKVGRKARLARDGKKGLFVNKSKGGSFRKGMRKVKTRGKLKTFKSNTRKSIGKIGRGIGRGFEKIGNVFRKIKLPKIKWPRIFKKK
jgi:hypothetical protein